MRTHVPTSSLLATALLAVTLGHAAAFGQDADGLQKRINDAVRRGRESLIPHLKRLVANPPKDYPMGRVALPLAAVLKAGASTKDPVVVQAFRRLGQMEPKKTYSVSCYLFALDALNQRKYKESLQHGGSTVVGASKRARGALRQKMVELVNWLVNARGLGQGYWNYGFLGRRGMGSRHDFSNTQFAVLGLQIGLEHGIPVPREVFVEIANQFVRSLNIDGKEMVVEVTDSTTLDDVLRGRTRLSSTRKYKREPGGWGYTAGKQKPYASMTAAGASSLLVALGGLSSGKTKQAAQAALVSAYGWITNNFNSYINGSRHYYYTLYSLEKVGDLGNLEKFGAHDWYAEGAKVLLAKQKANGAWGSYTDTSFALLFLTRATRLKPFMAPRITTNARGAAGKGVDPDLVYIHRLKGFLSAREILTYLAESRRSDLVSVGEEVVRNYSRENVGDLVPHLLTMWTGRNDRLSRFARASLEEITGQRRVSQKEAQLWHKEYTTLRSLRDKSLSSSELVELLKAVRSPNLKAQILDLANRLGHRHLIPELIAELEVPLASYRRKVHGLLALWTGHRLPAPEKDTSADWEAVTNGWRKWWAEHEIDFTVGRKLDALAERLEAADDKDAKKIAEEIVRLGKPAIPFLRRHLQRDEYSFRLVEVYERLSDTVVGLRPVQ